MSISRKIKLNGDGNIVVQNCAVSNLSAQEIAELRDSKIKSYTIDARTKSKLDRMIKKIERNFYRKSMSGEYILNCSECIRFVSKLPFRVDAYEKYVKSYFESKGYCVVYIYTYTWLTGLEFCISARLPGDTELLEAELAKMKMLPFIRR